MTKLPHDGGPCPVAPETRVRVWYRDGGGRPDPNELAADQYRWNHCEEGDPDGDYDILFYEPLDAPVVKAGECTRWRKKPVVIDAWQWDGRALVCDWAARPAERVLMTTPEQEADEIVRELRARATDSDLFRRAAAFIEHRAGGGDDNSVCKAHPARSGQECVEQVDCSEDPNLRVATVHTLAHTTGARERFRHKNRGAVYEVIGYAQVQCPKDGPLTEYEVVTVYKSLTGTLDNEHGLWVRRKSEFHDGRFEALSPSQSEEGRKP